MPAASPAAPRTQHSGLSTQHSPQRSRRSGPRTPAGRAAVSQNAVTHGLRSERPVLSSESEEEWDAHLAGTLAHFCPRDHYERCLAERVALSLWRLCRVTRYETAALSRGIDRAEDDARERLAQRHRGRPAPHPDAAAQFLREETEHLRRVRSTPGEDGTDHIVRYEGHLTRQLTSVLRALTASQARPLPQLQTAPHHQTAQTAGQPLPQPPDPPAAAIHETTEQSPTFGTSDGFDGSASSSAPTANREPAKQSPTFDGSDTSGTSGSSPDPTRESKTTEQSPPASDSREPLSFSRRFYLEYQRDIDARAAGRYVAIAAGQVFGFHHTLAAARADVAGEWDPLILLNGQDAGAPYAL